MSEFATFDTSLILAYSRPVGDFAVQDAQMESLRERYDRRSVDCQSVKCELSWSKLSATGQCGR